MDLLIDGLESRKNGEKYHDFVLSDAINSIKRAKEALEDGLKDPENWWNDSLIMAKTLVTIMPFMYLVQQRITHNQSQSAEENSPEEREEDSGAGDIYGPE